MQKCKKKKKKILQDQVKTITKFKKTGGFRELFLSENYFKSCSTVSFPKKHPDFGGLKTSERQNSDTNFFFSYALLHVNSI